MTPTGKSLRQQTQSLLSKMTDDQMVMYALAWLLQELPDPHGSVDEIRKALVRSATDEVMPLDIVFDHILSEMGAMSEKQRLELIDMLKDRYCIHCGYALADGRCHCMNDE